MTIVPRDRLISTANVNLDADIFLFLVYFFFKLEAKKIPSLLLSPLH